MKLALCSCHIKKYRREASSSSRLGFGSYSTVGAGSGQVGAAESQYIWLVGIVAYHSWWERGSSAVWERGKLDLDTCINGKEVQVPIG